MKGSRGGPEGGYQAAVQTGPKSEFEKDRRVCVTHPPCDQLWAIGTTQPVPLGHQATSRALIEPLLPG